MPGTAVVVVSVWAAARASLASEAATLAWASSSSAFSFSISDGEPLCSRKASPQQKMKARARQTRAFALPALDLLKNGSLVRSQHLRRQASHGHHRNERTMQPQCGRELQSATCHEVIPPSQCSTSSRSECQLCQSAGFRLEGFKGLASASRLTSQCHRIAWLIHTGSVKTSIP